MYDQEHFDYLLKLVANLRCLEFVLCPYLEKKSGATAATPPQDPTPGRLPVVYR